MLKRFENRQLSITNTNGRYKKCRFALFTKPFSEFECCKFENGVLGSFPEPVYVDFFIYNKLLPIHHCLDNHINWNHIADYSL